MWAHAVAAALGLWLMASPAVLGYGEPASTSSYVVGPIVFAFSFIAASDLGRPVRLVNVPLGAWLVVAPLAIGFETPALANSVAVGVAVAGLALLRGDVKRRYGGGWSALRE